MNRAEGDGFRFPDAVPETHTPEKLAARRAERKATVKTRRNKMRQATLSATATALGIAAIGSSERASGELERVANDTVTALRAPVDHMVDQIDLGLEYLGGERSVGDERYAVKTDGEHPVPREESPDTP